MVQQVVVQKGNTVILPVTVGFNVSENIIISQIYIDDDTESGVITSWSVSFKTNGTDGEIILTLDDSVTTDITESFGYMDLNLIRRGETLPVFSELLEILFLD